MNRLERIYLLPAVVMALLVAPYTAHATDNEPDFDARLEASAADIVFHQQDEAHARRILEILQQATELVAQRLPHSGGKVTAYLYASDDEMAHGLATVLGYSPMETNAVLKVGISEQRDNTLHLHPKTASWGSVLTHAIFDEHTHGVIQQTYGTGPAIHATWIEEGLTSYLAHELLAGSLAGFEDTYPERRFKVAFKALVFGKLPSLDDISTRDQWYNNINNSEETWNIQYALAYFAVSHLVKHYGFDSALGILSDVNKGESYKDSLEKTTGIALAGFERSMRTALLFKGIFELYWKYTLLVLTGLTVAFATATYALRKNRRRTITNAGR